MALSCRIISLASFPMASNPEDPDRKEKPLGAGRRDYSQLAFMLPAGTVAGYLLGSLLDRWLHASWIAIVGLLLGTSRRPD